MAAFPQPSGEASREHGWKPTIRLLNRFHTKSYQTLCFKPQASPVAFFILKVKPQTPKLKTQNSKLKTVSVLCPKAISPFWPALSRQRRPVWPVFEGFTRPAPLGPCRGWKRHYHAITCKNYNNVFSMS